MLGAVNTAAIADSGTSGGTKPEVRVLRAQPVGPTDDGTQDSKIKIDRPPPIDF